MEVRPFPFEQLPLVPRRLMGFPRRLRDHLGQGGAAALGERMQLLGLSTEEAPELRITTVSICLMEDIHEFVARSGVTFTLRGELEQQALLMIDSKLCSSIVAALLKTSPEFISGPITAAERGICAFMLAGLLHGLGEQCTWTLDPGVDFAFEGQTPWILVEVRVRWGTRSSLARLFIPEPLALRIGGEGRPVPMVMPRWLDSVYFSLPIRLARFMIPAGTLTTLVAGDMIIAPNCPHGGPISKCLLGIGYGGFPAVVRDMALELSASFQRGGLNMFNKEPTAPGTTSDQGAIAEQLAVELIVELGRLRMTGAEVFNLRPGDVIALDRPLSAPVDLRVGELLIGKGELVDVEGEAGIRMVELFD